METKAVKQVFGHRAERIPMSSQKSMVGHLIGASGALEAAATAITLDRGVIPPTINQATPDPDCDLDYVPNTAEGAAGEGRAVEQLRLRRPERLAGALAVRLSDRSPFQTSMPAADRPDRRGGDPALVPPGRGQVQSRSHFPSRIGPMANEARPMIHFSCDLCGKDLPADGKSRYVVRIAVEPGFDPCQITDADLDDDQFEELAEALRSGEHEALAAPDEDGRCGFRFDLCDECSAAFARDPLGKSYDRAPNPRSFSDN